jgi:predicted xylose isomerase-like sugar epimerase
LATYIVNVYKKEVHVSANITSKCNIEKMRDNHRIYTDTDDWSVGFNPFKRCPHCYIEKDIAKEA